MCFLAKDEAEREKVRSSGRKDEGVAAVDLLFPSPSGSNLSQGRGKKRKVCYIVQILDTLFWGDNNHFSRRNPNANIYLESSVVIYF